MQRDLGVRPKPRGGNELFPPDQLVTGTADSTLAAKHSWDLSYHVGIPTMFAYGLELYEL